MRQIHATENWDCSSPNQRWLILWMVPNEDQNLSSTELYFQMAGLINECELHKNNFSEETWVSPSFWNLQAREMYSMRKYFSMQFLVRFWCFQSFVDIFRPPKMKSHDPAKFWDLHFLEWNHNEVWDVLFVCFSMCWGWSARWQWNLSCKSWGLAPCSSYM